MFVFSKFFGSSRSVTFGESGSRCGVGNKNIGAEPVVKLDLPLSPSISTRGVRAASESLKSDGWHLSWKGHDFRRAPVFTLLQPQPWMANALVAADRYGYSVTIGAAHKIHADQLKVHGEICCAADCLNFFGMDARNVLHRSRFGALR
uniref:Uncharacterized protein n=1 Tax=Noctiluca scintillans TaxID=2966 RepID=A0A7S1AFJ3_NOCSC|mmetsp:Transcript_43837/g.115802  ORF Transcript_43837/g.115802 Transcript_43837/m.115802 type:complete len:148 (+) Transcript_43837:272-715(+)